MNVKVALSGMARRAVTTDFAPAIKNALANPRTPSMLIFPRALWQALRTTISALTFNLETSSTVRRLDFLVASVTLKEIVEILTKDPIEIYFSNPLLVIYDRLNRTKICFWLRQPNGGSQNNKTQENFTAKILKAI